MSPKKVYRESHRSFYSSTLSGVCKRIAGQRRDWLYDSTSRKLITDTTELRGLINSGSFSTWARKHFPIIFHY